MSRPHNPLDAPGAAPAAGRDPAGAAPGPADGAPDSAGLWVAVLGRLQSRMSLFSYRGFLEPLVPGPFVDDGAGLALLVYAPSAFLRDWARDHYAAELSHEATQLAGRPVRVAVEHDPAGQSAALAALAPAPDDTARPKRRASDVAAAVPSGDPGTPRRGPGENRPESRTESRTESRFENVVPLRPEARRSDSRQGARLNPRCTFDSFVTGPSNRIAWAAATAVAEHPGARYSPLFLFGGTGLGKTHLLQAIGHEVLQRHGSARVVYLSAEQWVNEYITEIHEKRFDAFRRRYRDNVDVLLIDDIQFLAGKAASQDEFFHTFNALHEQHKQIVVTSDRYPHEIAGLEERLKTRLQWGLVADVQPPEIETRLAILRAKAHSLGCALPLDVAEYLATQITSSIRELEGALVRLSAFSHITREPLTLDGAREHLKPVLANRAGRVTVQRVIDVVAAYYGLRPLELSSQSRQRQVTRARQVAMYLARHHLQMSLPEIGRAFGGRDHTTAHASVVKIAALKESDAGVQAVLARLTQSLF